MVQFHRKYGVKDSWRLLNITNKGNDWHDLLLMKEG